MRYFSKIKRCEKKGDTGIEHKRDVKHNSKLKKKQFIKYKIWRKEINKGIAKKRRHFKTKGFLMVQEGWKKHKTGDANGDTKSRKRENKKNGTRRKENGTRKTRVQKKRKKEKKEKHKENKMKQGKEKKERDLKENEDQNNAKRQKTEEISKNSQKKKRRNKEEKKRR